MSQWQPASIPPMEPDPRVIYEDRTYIVTDGAVVGFCRYARGGGAINRPWASWSEYGDFPPNRITHWMPLPDPP